jgi:alkylation response protein AidB-like acyl-CoA dehydrogenase
MTSGIYFYHWLRNNNFSDKLKRFSQLRRSKMSLADRNNPYSFNDFLEWRRKVDYYRDDSFIQQVIRYYAGDAFETVNAEARTVSKKVSFRWRDLSERIAQPEKRPYMMHYDGHHNRIDRIVRPAEIEMLEKEVFSEAVFSDKTSPWVKLIKMYLIYQNGEACIACPLVCTEGLVMVLEKYAESEDTKRILRHCKEGIDGDYGIGAQYLSEIQGGSDVPANLLEAVEENGVWKLYGTKFFCSATHADYAVITAKPAGSEKVALFVVPSWLPGNKQKEIRNGFTIDRIKWKLGTSELTTGELTFNGAVAYPVGPLDRGVAIVVGIVLTYSRLTVGLSAAAFMTRAVREAKKYAEFRGAFGTKIERFPLLYENVSRLEHVTKRTTAAAFKLYRDFLSLEGGLKPGLVADEPEGLRKKRFDVRELVMLQKITAAWDSTELLHETMSIFGGHGVMEDFSSLPRLYRDSAVNELWEGPRNVLLTQIYRDMKRVMDWYDPAEFVGNLLNGADQAIVGKLANEMKKLMNYPDIYSMNPDTIGAWRRWDLFCAELFHVYQDFALREVEEGAQHNEAKKKIPEGEAGPLKIEATV